MRRIRGPESAALFLLILCSNANAQSVERQSEFTTAVRKVGTDLARSYGYCGSKTRGAIRSVLVGRDGEAETFLYLQPLSCGDRVGALVDVDGGDVDVEVVTHDALMGFVQRLAGVSRKIDEIDPAEELEETSTVSNAPIREEEGALKEAKGAMGASDAIQAVRTRDDNTYHTSVHAATLSFIDKRGMPTWYVLGAELIGSTKSGKPYVDVYLRGYGVVGGMLTDSGAPRSQMIKHKPWKHLQDPPTREEVERKGARPKARKGAKARSGGTFKPSAADTKLHRELAFARITKELKAAIDLAGPDQVVIVGFDSAGDGKDFVYALTESPGSRSRGMMVIVSRVVVDASKEQPTCDRIREVPQLSLEAALDDLQASYAETDEDDLEEEEDARSFTGPAASTSSAESSMRSVAQEMFDTDPDMLRLLRHVASRGGKIGQSHAITVGREQKDNFTKGCYYFLVTRSVSKLHKRTKEPLDTFTTYGRIYQFAFGGGEPRVRPPSYMSKVMGMKNIE